MVLVDTSVWVSHFREGSKHLEELLEDADTASHPFIIGELACGNLKNRKEILSLLQTLPSVKEAAHKEVMQFIDKAELPGKGVGYVDVHLLASALLSDVKLWTLDRNLDRAAAALGIKYT